MKLVYGVYKLLWAPELRQDDSKGLPVHPVRSLGHVNKDLIQVHDLLLACLLCLANGEAHDHSAAVWRDPHCVSGRIPSETFVTNRLRRIRASTFPVVEKREIPW